MTLSSCDVCELAAAMLYKAGVEFSDEDGPEEVYRALLNAHLYQESRPRVTVIVRVTTPYSALLWVKINKSQILYAVLDSRIVDVHWPGKGKRKKRKDCAIRLYWGPDYVSGDSHRSKSIHEVRAWMKRIGADDTEFVEAAQALGWEDELIFTEEELHGATELCHEEDTERQS